jgi:hypothetical protein
MPLSTYRTGLFTGIFLLFLACSGGPSREDLQYLGGYWEIRRVEFPDGSEKQYTANTAIEYLEWDGESGFRKKMQPTLKGTYLTSDDALPMKVLWRDQRLFLSFKGEETPWEEEVLDLQEDILITRHANGLQYEYARYEPLLIPDQRAQERQSTISE